MKSKTIRGFLALLLIATCLPNLGCSGTLGPRVETKYVILKAGRPGRVLENQRVKVQALNDDTIKEVDIGGWIVMPPEHFEALKRAVEENQ